MRFNGGVTVVALSDAELVARCRRGDEAAWAALVERFSRYVYAIATQGFRLSDADAEEVFQETFARTFTHLDRLRDDDAVRGWIGQLARRLCVDEIRRRGRIEPTAEDPELPVVDERLARLDDALSVHDALATPAARVPRHPRPLLLPGPELRDHRRGAGSAAPARSPAASPAASASSAMHTAGRNSVRNSV